MKLCENLLLLTLVSFIILGLELLLLENVFRHISEYAKVFNVSHQILFQKLNSLSS